MAGRSRCCLRGSPNPLGFQSIANYHPNALLSSWRGGGGQKRARRRDSALPDLQRPPPPTPHLCSISVPLSKRRSILRRADTSFHLHHAIFIPHAEATTHGEEPAFMPVSLRLPFTSPHLIRDHIYGEEKGRRRVKDAHMS